MRISDWSSDVCSSDLQFGKDRDVSGAISAQVKFNDLAILFDICEPGRTPADLPFHSDDATASDFLHEGPDTRDCVVIVNGCDVCAVAHRNSSPGLDSSWAGHDNPAKHIFVYHIAASDDEAEVGRASFRESVGQ